MAEGTIADALAGIYDDVVASRTAAAPELHVYPLWQPDMALPAVWFWLAEGTVVRPRPDTCTVRQIDRLVVTVGVDPSALITLDARRLIDYVAALRPALDPAVYARRPWGCHEAAWASGSRFVSDQLGDAQILCAELPIEVTTDRTVNTAP
jgi:hypothetical protein